jgi:hypothetical protein
VTITFGKAGPRESLLKRLAARSECASVAYEEGGCVSRVAIVALARLACAATGGSFSISSSTRFRVRYTFSNETWEKAPSKTGDVPNLRNGKELAMDVFVGDWAKK